jgi:tetratricopeptide (TPR) repeat protein
MKLKIILTPFIICQSIFCWLSKTPAMAQSLTSRSAMAASYIERGNAWAAKGEWEQALADYDLAIATDLSAAGSYYNRGIAWFHLRDYERARAESPAPFSSNPKTVRLTGSATAQFGNDLDE